jgi:hypothetical protein
MRGDVRSAPGRTAHLNSPATGYPGCNAAPAILGQDAGDTREGETKMATTRENWTMSLTDLHDLEYHVMPQDEGQIVEYSYALWTDGCGGGLVIQRVHDRSDGSTDYYAAESRGDFEPWNGDCGRAGKFLPVVAKDDQ